MSMNHTERFGERARKQDDWLSIIAKMATFRPTNARNLVLHCIPSVLPCTGVQQAVQVLEGSESATPVT